MDDDSDIQSLILESENSEEVQDIMVEFIEPRRCNGTLRFEDDEIIIKYNDSYPLRVSYFKIINWRSSKLIWGIDYKDSNKVMNRIMVKYKDPAELNKMIREKVNYFVNNVL